MLCYGFTYDYDRRNKVANTDETIVALGSILQSTRERIRDIVEKIPQDNYVPQRVAALLKVTFQLMQRAGAAQAFIDIIRLYELNPRDRKVIEAASRMFSKSRIVIKPEKALAVYEDWLYEVDTAIETARAALHRNERHVDMGSTTTRAVGSFTLINTGGFPDKTMAECGKVVEKAEKLLRAKGLGKVCYGPVHVTNTIHKATTLAFYLRGDDTMYIRANLKGKVGPALRSVIHELAHRLQYRFLAAKKRDIDVLYRALKDKQRASLDALLMDRSLWPKEGDTQEYKGETFIFDKVDITSRANLKAIFRLPDHPGYRLDVGLGGFIAEKYPEKLQSAKQTFITPYAATDPDENFADMVAYYCQDALPADQVAMLEPILR